MKKVHHVLVRHVVGDDYYFNFFSEKIETYGRIVVVSTSVSSETKNFLTSRGYICWGSKGMYQFIKSGSKPPKNGEDIHFVYPLVNEEELGKLLKLIAAKESVIDVKKENGHWVISTETKE